MNHQSRFSGASFRRGGFSGLAAFRVESSQGALRDEVVRAIAVDGLLGVIANAHFRLRRRRGGRRRRIRSSRNRRRSRLSKGAIHCVNELLPLSIIACLLINGLLISLLSCLSIDSHFNFLPLSII